MPQVSVHNANSDTTINGGTERVLVWSNPTASASVTFSVGGSVEYLVLGPGGSGGVDGGGVATGGAGAGGYLRGTTTFSATDYALKVGDSGSRRLFAVDGQGPGFAGDPTTIALASTPTVFILEAFPGSPGTRRNDAYPAGPFGSGAGAPALDGVKSAGTAGQGFDGGARTQPEGFWQAASGGSAASAGPDQLRTQAQPVYTPGVSDSITGSPEEYGRGGPGATFQGNYPTSQIDGRAGFGDGAGGLSEANNGPHKEGGKGGSGTIILRFTLPAGGETADITLTAPASAMSASVARGASATTQTTAQAAQAASDGTRGTGASLTTTAAAAGTAAAGLRASDASSAMGSAAGVGVATGSRSSSGETAIQAAPGDLDISAIRSVTAAVADITMTAAAAQVSSAAIRASGLSASAQAAAAAAAFTGRRGVGASLALQGSPVTITATGFRTTSVSVTAMAAAGVFYLIEALPVVFGSPQHFITVTRGPHSVTAQRGPYRVTATRG